MIVLKLGGSLASSGGLAACLGALAALRGEIVVVPGGGVFADAVRAAQPRFGFSDRAAHHMAILAMEQYALMLADRLPRLKPCASLDGMRTAVAAGHPAIWLPATLALADPMIPQSWDVTADSLAAWLARRLAAERLVLVKSVAAPRPLDIAALAADGLVDKAFPVFFAGAGLALDWIGPGEEACLIERLAA
jgi:5-(aminomethyl)-3-furanmethanol phosphate kinase